MAPMPYASRWLRVAPPAKTSTSILNASNLGATLPTNSGNVTRFVLGRFGDWKPDASAIVTGHCLLNYPYTVADRWIMSRYQRLVADVDRLMKSYNYGEAARQTQEFVWNEFADWYVEIAQGTTRR